MVHCKYTVHHNQYNDFQGLHIWKTCTPSSHAYATIEICGHNVCIQFISIKGYLLVHGKGPAIPNSLHVKQTKSIRFKSCL